VQPVHQRQAVQGELRVQAPRVRAHAGPVQLPQDAQEQGRKPQQLLHPRLLRRDAQRPPLRRQPRAVAEAPEGLQELRAAREGVPRGRAQLLRVKLKTYTECVCQQKINLLILCIKN